MTNEHRGTYTSLFENQTLIVPVLKQLEIAKLEKKKKEKKRKKEKVELMIPTFEETHIERDRNVFHPQFLLSCLLSPSSFLSLVREEQDTPGVCFICGDR